MTAEQKRLLQRAADIAGRSLTDFVLSSAQDAAVRTIQQHDVILLSAADQKYFVDALLKPPAPSKKLRSAWRRQPGLGLR